MMSIIISIVNRLIFVVIFLEKSNLTIISELYKH